MVVISVLFAVLLSGTQAADAQVDGLVYTEDTVFTLVDDEIHVVTEAAMSNTSAERRDGNTVYYSYFDTFVSVVPIGVDDLTITSRGAVLESTAQALDDNFELRTTRIPGELRSGQSRSFTVSYTLPTGEIRGDGLFFSNPAFHAFPLWSFSDPGTGSLVLRASEDIDMSDFGELLRRSELGDGTVEWTPRDFDRPEDLFAYVTLTVDEELDRTRVAVSGQTIELQSWPGDRAWVTFAAETITQGVPELEALIGLPIPEQDTLQVTESVNPYFYGYGGWYDPSATSIEIGNELDQTVMIHELSHAWFNRDLFVERWISEGLAEEYTWRALDSLGWDPEDLPDTPDASSSAAAPLILWGENGIGAVTDAEFRAEENYGYETSWYVLHELYELAGPTGMQQILAAANSRSTAYPGADLNEITYKQGDWRRLLDLASLYVDDAEELEIDELFGRYVLDDAGRELVERRREVRDQYQALIADGVGWNVPDELRYSLESWQFDTAEAALVGAADVQGRFTEVADLADIAGLELSNVAQQQYEQGVARFDDALDILDRQANAIAEVEQVQSIVAQELTTAERWGLGDASLDVFAVVAEDAFAADDFGEIEAARVGAQSVLARAEVVGAQRILWAKVGSGAGGLLVALSTLVGMRSRRRLDSYDLTSGDVVLAA